MTICIIASSAGWFNSHQKSKAYSNQNFININDKESLNPGNIKNVNPRYIFFPHWEWIIPKEIYNNFECIVFHTAPLPYGRGGSPIQNLIRRGFSASPVCALQADKTIDGGAIYCTQPVSLRGNIDEIFSRIAVKIEVMILDIIATEPHPKPQVGKPTKFLRLQNTDNKITPDKLLAEMYDEIRMVDGAHYEKAYMLFGDYKIELSNAKYFDKELTAEITIKKLD